MNEKMIFVRHGQVLTVECLRDGVTGEGFFILKNEEGEAVRASEFRTVEGVVFTADESKRKLALAGMEYQVFEAIQDHLKTNKVSSMLMCDLARMVNERLGLRIGLTSSSVSKICRSLGMRSIRKPEGFVVSLEDEDLKIASLKFQDHPTE